MPTDNWTLELHAEANRILDWSLDGVGNPEKERQFRTCAIMSRQRTLTEAERDSLPAWWKNAAALDVAGSPVEVLWTRGCSERLSTQPCRNPFREVVPQQPHLYMTVDCGRCETCLDRQLARRTARGAA